ncbi:hypothetical protein [Modestobacter versicolor]|uniref:Uncharacterized protein n=1 Tax=Modestobacter versicolor TaxID=429133 RepID=A0A323V984_9ACTN|nr:hypothetical protein [Modestobacter versicolor]MBB3674534.1 hypothetical protein [Modestobacter versicolor]PZA21324.1 hypothetical protein DMO24_10875 [Modestobacter versicolor]
MRVAFLVYGVLYVVIEVVGYQLEQVSWPEITPLDVATALTNAFLTVAVLVAVLVAVDVLGHRWRRHLQAVRLEEARLAAEEWAGPGPITVPSWRPGPLPQPRALPAGPPPAARAQADNAYARQAWPEDAGTDRSRRLL